MPTIRHGNNISRIVNSILTIPNIMLISIIAKENVLPIKKPYFN